jgi:hypothetical protein
MNTDYIVLCGVMWCRFGEQDAGRELLRAADSMDPDMSALAWAMLAKGASHFREFGKTGTDFNALSKMKAAGHIEVTGTLGYDCSYIQMIPTPTGRKIRFVTNRLLKFGEVYWDTRSTAYNLTAGEFDLNDTDKSKSTGVLYPAAEFVIDKQGELQINLIGNPFNLVDVLDWKGTPGVN